MVLVNRCRGCNSNVPSYNPRDIVANLRHLLNYECMEPMDPWYRGFKVSKASSTYSSTGVIEVVSETTLHITELPIHCWTSDYIATMESLIMVDLQGIRLMRHDHTSIQLELTLDEKNMELATQEGLEKKLNLITTVGTTIMHLFGTTGLTIRKYKTPEEFLEEFFDLRLEYYEKRKRKGFAPLPKSIERPEGGKRVTESGYDYLLSLPISSVDPEKVHELYAETSTLEEKREEVRRATPSWLWMKDLDALEVELDVSMVEIVHDKCTEVPLPEVRPADNVLDSTSGYTGVFELLSYVYHIGAD
ncbi:hypothetical protein ACQ4PT_057321 [Festuca glaucescens]